MNPNESGEASEMLISPILRGSRDMLGFRVTVITLGNGLMQVVISPLYRAINLKGSRIGPETLQPQTEIL